jgi:hypothetical protein
LHNSIAQGHFTEQACILIFEIELINDNFQMKVICVPINHSAVERLNYHINETNDLIEMDLDDKMLRRLFEIDFFDKINAVSGVLIDDFEDEKIVGIPAITKVLDSNIFDTVGYDIEFHNVLGEIKSLFQEAFDRGTGVFFYF